MTLHSISDNISLIASVSNWVEGEALEQLKHFSSLPGMVEAVGMPDIYPGRGWPVALNCLYRDSGVKIPISLCAMGVLWNA